MAKLYPPLIEGTIPAFYGDSITIPFSMNKTVSIDNDVAGFSLKFKTVQNNIQLETLTSSTYNSSQAIFSLSSDLIEKLKVGQFYKVQLAYINRDQEIGHYSTVGVVKYTAEPEVRIGDLVAGERNAHEYVYNGYYKQEKDPTEKVYSYNFKIYDADNNIVEETGEKLHFYNGDSYKTLESVDTYTTSFDLEENAFYTIQYTITTLNGLVVSSPRYRIAQKQFVLPEMDAELITELDYENGCVNIGLRGSVNNREVEKVASGSFVLSRKNVLEPRKWEELLRFDLRSQRPSSWSWKDFTIEQGITYVYALQQYSDKLFSQRIESEEVKADFEHAFLFDGKRQLKIKYDPKVSSFKTTLLESKVETLGGKHPFFTRSGNVSYKDFPISGLVSYLMDEDNFFLNNVFDNPHRTNTIISKFLEPEEKEKINAKRKTAIKSTDLSRENIYKEREFKLAVLDWLNDGQPKLFRSPTEGNYIVRLMNASLSPNDTLGRLIHTFSCNAYEVADYTYQNLTSYKFIDSKSGLKESENIIYWASIEVNDLLPLNPEQGETENLLKNGRKANTIDIVDMVSGDKVKIVYEDGSEYTIVIGATGAYKAPNIMPITGIYLSKLNAKSSGILTYSYIGERKNAFGLYRDAVSKEIPAKQIFGTNVLYKNIMSTLQDIKTSILSVYYILIEKRPIKTLFIDKGIDIKKIDNKDGTYRVDFANSKFYADNYRTQEIKKEDLDPISLYEIRSSDLVSEMFTNKGTFNFIKDEEKGYFSSDISSLGLEIKEDKVILVDFNNKTIPVDAYKLNDIYLFGNKSIYDNNIFISTGEDFALEYFNNKWTIYTLIEGDSHDVKVYSITKKEFNEDYYIDNFLNIVCPVQDTYIDGNEGILIPKSDYSTKFYIDTGAKDNLSVNELKEVLKIAQYFDLEDTYAEEFENIKLKDLYIGNGLMLTLGYCASVVEYSFEDNKAYLDAVALYKEDLANFGKEYNGRIIDENILKEDEEKIKEEYKSLITRLTVQLELYKKEHGLNE